MHLRSGIPIGSKRDARYTNHYAGEDSHKKVQNKSTYYYSLLPYLVEGEQSQDKQYY